MTEERSMDLTGQGGDPLQLSMMQLAVAQAVYKAVASLVSTKDPGNLRGRVDAEIRARYAEDGSKSRDLRVQGVKVGTISLKVTEPERRQAMRVTDREAFEAWAVENGKGRHETVTAFRCDEEEVLREAMANGEVPDGCEFEVVDVPGKVGGTTLRVDAKKVNDALGGMLTTGVMGLLGVGDE